MALRVSFCLDLEAVVVEVEAEAEAETEVEVEVEVAVAWRVEVEHALEKDDLGSVEIKWKIVEVWVQKGLKVGLERVEVVIVGVKGEHLPH